MSMFPSTQGTGSSASCFAIFVLFFVTYATILTMSKYNIQETHTDK